MLAKLLATMGSLSPSEQRVGRLVLKNPQEFSTMSRGLPFVHGAIDAADSSSKVALKVIDNSIASMTVFRAEVPKVSIERASCALAASHASSRCVAFYGSGHSGLVAQDAQLRFSRMGFSTVACADGYTHDCLHVHHERTQRLLRHRRYA
jgi:DNA-binding MurR/RpiR family transcriptional regulator